MSALMPVYTHLRLYVQVSHKFEMVLLTGTWWFQAGSITWLLVHSDFWELALAWCNRISYLKSKLAFGRLRLGCIKVWYVPKAGQHVRIQYWGAACLKASYPVLHLLLKKTNGTWNATSLWQHCYCKVCGTSSANTYSSVVSCLANLFSEWKKCKGVC